MNLQERIDIVVTVFVCLKHRKLFTSRLPIKQITNWKQKKGTLYNVQCLICIALFLNSFCSSYKHINLNHSLLTSSSKIRIGRSLFPFGFHGTLICFYLSLTIELNETKNWFYEQKAICSCFFCPFGSVSAKSDEIDILRNRPIINDNSLDSWNVFLIW